MRLRLYYRFARMRLYRWRNKAAPMSRAEGYKKLGEITKEVQHSAESFEKKLHEVENFLRHGR